MRRIELPDETGDVSEQVAQNIAALTRLFPQLLTEDSTGQAVDVEVLKQLVGDRTIEQGEERFGLSWHGKRAARQLALTSSRGTLRPAPEDSVDWDGTQNLVVEGDNLEVLKLLQKSLAGKVKLIYIDPPYNTGNDFVYRDDFKDGVQHYLEVTGQLEGGARISSNTEAGGRFHTEWLNMMYPRLKLAREMLAATGALLVSCDESEHPRLRLALDEIFGGENFVADFVWRGGRKNDSKLVSVSHEYIVCYVRDASHVASEKIEWRLRKRGLDDIYRQYDRIRAEHGRDYASASRALKDWFKALPQDHPARDHKHYSSVDARGIYFPDNISWPGGGGPTYEVLHPVTRRPVRVPSRGWIYSSPEKMQSLIDDDRVHFGEDENSVPCIKAYLSDRETQAPLSVFYRDGRAATKRLRTLMSEKNVFDFPKDEILIQELIEMSTSEGDVVLDFFAGSGTTGHAVMAQNAVDGGSRRFVLVQLPEPLDPEVKEQKVAAEFCDALGKPRNIAELTKERLRRAGAKVREENPMFAGDVGFRVFKLDSSNLTAWDPDREDLEESLLAAVESVKTDRSESDVLYELLLRLGIDLCVPIEERAIAGKVVHAVGGGVLLACLAERVGREDVEGLAGGIVGWIGELAPVGDVTCVFRDAAFDDDVVKTNVTAVLEQHGVTTVRSI